MAVGDIITSDGKTLTIEDLRKIAVEVEKLISSNSKDPGEWEEVKSLSGITSLPVLQSLGASYKLVHFLFKVHSASETCTVICFFSWSFSIRIATILFCSSPVNASGSESDKVRRFPSE